jgi:hypothetical protein
MKGRTLHGTTYVATATTPSGRGDTSSGNFLANLEALARAIARICGPQRKPIYLIINGDDWMAAVPRAMERALRVAMVAETARAGFNLTVFDVTDTCFDFCSGWFYPAAGAYYYASKPFRAIHRFHVRRVDDGWPAQVWQQADALERTSRHIPVLHEYAARVKEIYAYHASSDKSWTPNKYKFHSTNVPDWDESTLDAMCTIYDITRSDVRELVELVAGSVIGQDLCENETFRSCLDRDLG